MIALGRRYLWRLGALDINNELSGSSSTGASGDHQDLQDYRPMRLLFRLAKGRQDFLGLIRLSFRAKAKICCQKTIVPDRNYKRSDNLIWRMPGNRYCEMALKAQGKKGRSVCRSISGQFERAFGDSGPKMRYGKSVDFEKLLLYFQYIFAPMWTFDSR